MRDSLRRRSYLHIMTDRAAYPSDLSDARWALIEPRLSAWRQARTDDAGVRGRTANHDLREISNAILYVNRTGIAWRYLPHDLPPWQTARAAIAASARGRRAHLERISLTAARSVLTHLAPSRGASIRSASAFVIMSRTSRWTPWAVVRPASWSRLVGGFRQWKHLPRRVR